jgi:flagellar hook-associated protein FlgK
MDGMIDFSVPLAGLDRAVSSLNQMAQKIANPGTAGPGDIVDLSSQAVAVMESQRNFESNLKTIQTQNHMIETVLRLLA